MNKFPIYIVSKGRADSRLTVKALEAMKVPYFIVIEEQEYKIYSDVIEKSKILILDQSFKEKYQLCDDLGLTKSTGPGPARNFAWEHSLYNNNEFHWVMDDNIQCFYYYNNNKKIKILNYKAFAIIEDFILQYKNIGMAGPNYDFFCPKKIKHPPFILNTRIYSCNLIRNNLPFRWRGRYNEDTDLSLRILKSGLCTVQLNVVLQKKTVTQQLKGGNTDEFYAKEGTANKSLMQIKLHPDVSTLVHKFGRIHHHVNYKVFKQQLIRKRNYQKMTHDLSIKSVDASD
jgi:hypothetical protein